MPKFDPKPISNNMQDRLLTRIYDLIKMTVADLCCFVCWRILIQADRLQLLLLIFSMVRLQHFISGIIFLSIPDSQKYLGYFEEGIALHM